MPMSDKILKADPIFFRCRMSITWNVLASAGKSRECQRVAIEGSSICSAMENWDFISIDRDLEIVATYFLQVLPSPILIKTSLIIAESCSDAIHPSPHRSTQFCPIIVGWWFQVHGSVLHSWDRTKEHVGCAAQVSSSSVWFPSRGHLNDRTHVK